MHNFQEQQSIETTKFSSWFYRSKVSNNRSLISLWSTTKIHYSVKWSGLSWKYLDLINPWNFNIHQILEVNKSLIPTCAIGVISQRSISVISVCSEPALVGEFAVSVRTPGEDEIANLVNRYKMSWDHNGMCSKWVLGTCTLCPDSGSRITER